MTHHQNGLRWGKVAKGLAWFSLALGASEILAPRLLTKIAGLPSRPKMLKAFGAREIGAGLAILLARRTAPGLWARVAGDFLDLGALGTAFRSHGTRRGRTIMSAAAVAGITALDIIAARAASQGRALRPH